MKRRIKIRRGELCSPADGQGCLSLRVHQIYLVLWEKRTAHSLHIYQMQLGLCETALHIPTMQIGVLCICEGIYLYAPRKQLSAGDLSVNLLRYEMHTFF